MSTLELFDDETVVEQFLSHYDDLRGRVRVRVVRQHLRKVLLDATTGPLRVLDVGCGDGRDSLWLARAGHHVLGLDPAEAMLERAREHVAAERLAGELSFALGDASTALEQFGPESFDLVCSHGVILYSDDPASFIADHVRLVRRNGMVSLLAKNADGQPHRAAQETSVDEALRLLDDPQGVGHLGLSRRAQSLQQLADLAFRAGATVRSWAGVRIFSDTLGEPVRYADEDKVLELEWKAALRDPHRRTAALLHVMLLRGVDLSLLPA